TWSRDGRQLFVVRQTADLKDFVDTVDVATTRLTASVAAQIPDHQIATGGTPPVVTLSDGRIALTVWPSPIDTQLGNGETKREFPGESTSIVVLDPATGKGTTLVDHVKNMLPWISVDGAGDHLLYADDKALHTLDREGHVETIAPGVLSAAW